MSLQQLVILVTALFLSLIAGLFYAYSCSVNPGLGRLQGHEYLKAMQSINRAILNPVFLVPFVLTLILLPLSAWLAYRGGNSLQFYLLLSAAAIYGGGVFGITVLGNVPLNEMLDKTDLTNMEIMRVEELRAKFETPWLRFHAIRTGASVTACLLVLLALVKR